MSALPKGWAMTPLGDVATLQRGFDLPVQNRCEGFVEIYAANGPVGTHVEAKVRGPGVVTGRSGTLGKVHFVEQDFWPLNTALWVKDFHRNDRAWVYRLLSWMRLERFTRGAGVPTLNRNLVHVVEVPVPPLAEQKRIVAILNAADALRAKRRESLAQLDVLRRATFLTLFGDPVENPMRWTMTRLPLISTRFTDGPFGSNLKSSHYVSEGIRVIRLQNIGVEEMLHDDLAFISRQHYDSLPRNHCMPGDVVIGTMGDPNLRACIVPESLTESLNKADCLLLRVDEAQAHRRYVCSLLNCAATVGKALGLVRGQTRGRISLGRLRELDIPLAPLGLQREFATFVESIEQQKALQHAQLTELDALFASLQHRAFNGNLRTA
jgi:type I restriction enzyme S subunit